MKEGWWWKFSPWQSVRKIFFAKHAIFSKKMSESKIFFKLTQATNTYKHISRNIGATMTASRISSWQSFSFYYKKVLKKKCITIKKGYSSKSLHWYQWISVWKVDDES